MGQSIPDARLCGTATVTLCTISIYVHSIHFFDYQSVWTSPVAFVQSVLLWIILNSLVLCYGMMQHLCHGLINHAGDPYGC